MIRTWTGDMPIEEAALKQLADVAQLPILAGHIAVMPDVHMGVGACVGSVIPTEGAIIPSAVGVDIGCGMAAIRTTLRASDLPESLATVRAQIERDVPVGFNQHKDPATTIERASKYDKRLVRRMDDRQFTLDDLAAQTAGVECRKDVGVIDEIPGAYKNIDSVMNAQRELVNVIATLKAVLCVKG